MCTDIIKKSPSKGSLHEAQTKQAWKSPEIHGKTAPEAIYKEMQRRTKDKAEEENLVGKKKKIKKENKKHKCFTSAW